MTRFEVVYVLGIATGLGARGGLHAGSEWGFAMSEAARALWSLLVLAVLIVVVWVALGLAVRGAYELFLVGWELFA